MLCEACPWGILKDLAVLLLWSFAKATQEFKRRTQRLFLCPRKPFELTHWCSRSFEGGMDLRRLPQFCLTTCYEVKARVYRILDRNARPESGSSATNKQRASRDSPAEGTIQLGVKRYPSQWWLLRGELLKLRSDVYGVTSISSSNFVWHGRASLLFTTPLEQMQHQGTLLLSPHIQEHWS